MLLLEFFLGDCCCCRTGDVSWDSSFMDECSFAMFAFSSTSSRLVVVVVVVVNMDVNKEAAPSG